MFCRSRPNPRSRHPPPLTCSLLPVLTALKFDGVSEYLEDLVAQIDAPLQASAEAHMEFSDWQVWVELPRWSLDTNLEFTILCRQSDWQLSSLAQVCGSSFPQSLIPPVEYLNIEGHSIFLTLP